jgi:hypothetical protein
MAVDGDGATLSGRAIYRGFLAGMDPKHPLAAAVLRAVYLSLEEVGMKRAGLTAFTAVSVLCAVGTFLLLACSIFPRFIWSRPISLACSLGVVLSYGVLSRASTIEVYVPALFCDVALLAYCLKSQFARDVNAITVGLILLLAVGFHVTNVLIIPAVAAVMILRTPRGRLIRTLSWGGATFLLGIGAIVFLLWLGLGAGKWPPDLALVAPRGEPQPPLGLGGHLSRSAYGFARTVAFLPDFRELETTLAAPYAVLWGGFLALCAYLASSGFLANLAQNRRILQLLALLVVPFTWIGIYYYPSDPERWLFLMPPWWLSIGLVWDQFDRSPGRKIVQCGSPVLLGVIVLGMAAYNAAALLPATHAAPGLAGLRQLSRLTTDDDLVISPSGITGELNEFYLDRPIRAENLTLLALAEEHGPDIARMQADFAQEIDRALKRGRRVFVYGLNWEPREQRPTGYPWGSMKYDYAPDSFLGVLRLYARDTVQPRSRSTAGIVRLRAGPESIALPEERVVQ